MYSQNAKLANSIPLENCRERRNWTRFLSIGDEVCAIYCTCTTRVQIRGIDIRQYPVEPTIYENLFRPASGAIDNTRARSRARSRSSRAAKPRAGRALSYRNANGVGDHPLSSLEIPEGEGRGREEGGREGCVVVSGVAQGSSRRREASLCTGNEFASRIQRTGY